MGCSSLTLVVLAAAFFSLSVGSAAFKNLDWKLAVPPLRLPSSFSLPCWNSAFFCLSNSSNLAGSDSAILSQARKFCLATASPSLREAWALMPRSVLSCARKSLMPLASDA